MKLDGLTEQQVKIADMLWACDTLEQARAVVDRFGNEASVVMELMLLASLDNDVDNMEEYPDAQQLLNKIISSK